MRTILVAIANVIGIALLGALIYDAYRQAAANPNAPIDIEDAPERMSGKVIGLNILGGLIGLPLGASLLIDGARAIAVDFGVSEAERWVVLFSPDETQLVQQRLARELRRTGWTLVDGDTNRGTYRRGSLRVVMSIRDARPGTEIQIEY